MTIIIAISLICLNVSILVIFFSERSSSISRKRKYKYLRRNLLDAIDYAYKNEFRPYPELNEFRPYSDFQNNNAINHILHIRILLSEINMEDLQSDIHTLTRVIPYLQEFEKQDRERTNKKGQ